MTEPITDPNTPDADVDAFVAVIRKAFGERAQEDHHVTGGHVWRWAHKGLWKLTAGAALLTEPLLEGPRGYLRLARCDDWHARLVLVILGAIDALPAGVEPPAVVPSQPAAVGRVYGGYRRPPATAPAVGYQATRPQYREPGANTGMRPHPRFTSHAAGPDQPPAGRGPGASYAPQVVDPGPAPARPDIAGSDLWPGGRVAGVDDAGHTVEQPQHRRWPDGPDPDTSTE